MCGIFGLVKNKDSRLTPEETEKIISELFKLSESRGKEAAGLALIKEKNIYVKKAPLPASRLIRGRAYHDLIGSENISAIIGHARLVTNGSMEENKNNQPVIKNGLAAVHNGIIVNDGELWKKFSLLKKECEVDTEILLALLYKFHAETNSLREAAQKTFAEIKGTASVAALFSHLNFLLLATNNGSLYLAEHKNFKIFASELFILEKILSRGKIKQAAADCQISQLKPGAACLINIDSLEAAKFSLVSPLPAAEINEHFSPANIFSIIELPAEEEITAKKNPPQILTPAALEKFYPNLDKINSLRRCAKCLLPETMPLIEFDEAGVCNYCRNYKKNEIKGKENLDKILEQYRRSDGGPDCLAAFSGGRDSSYGLHYLKKELGMNPLAFTYDWGMITDLGRRNQARMCGQLGVEHILVSADIRKKREYIRKNVTAWLKKPDLGTIPLFMAGDKLYFYYANKLMERTGAKVVVMSENFLERTHFKHGFCGVKYNKIDKSPYFLSSLDKIKLAFYYAKKFMANPAYLNSSLTDTLTGYISYYLIPHNYLYLYEYIPWEEKTVNEILIKGYDWELAPDTKSTWRIGDGTAPFYNYIYYLLAGFTENDTFRSNQIREGLLTREEARQLAGEDNQPRFLSIKWYCDTIGLDFYDTLKKISSLPKLYEK